MFLCLNFGYFRIQKLTLGGSIHGDSASYAVINPSLKVPFLADTIYGFLSNNCLFNIAMTENDSSDLNDENLDETISLSLIVTFAKQLDTGAYLKPISAAGFELNQIEAMTYAQDTIETAFVFVGTKKSTRDEKNGAARTREVDTLVLDVMFAFRDESDSLIGSSIGRNSDDLDARMVLAKRRKLLNAGYNNYNNIQMQQNVFQCDWMFYKPNVECEFNGRRYRIMQKIGSGTHATVWGANQLEVVQNNVIVAPAKLVAIKVYDFSHLEQFQIEKEMLSRLQNVPNAAQMIDSTLYTPVDNNGKTLLIITEYLNGGSVASILNNPPMSMDSYLAAEFIRKMLV